MINSEKSSSDLSASRLIGRVGGLAVALGVGAVCFSGVAWADSGSDVGASNDRTSHTRGESAGQRSASPSRAAGADNGSDVAPSRDSASYARGESAGPQSASPSRAARDRGAPIGAAAVVDAQRTPSNDSIESSDGSVAGGAEAEIPAPKVIEAVEAAPAADPAPAVPDPVPAATPPAPPSVTPAAAVAAPALPAAAVIEAAPVAAPVVAAPAQMSAVTTAGIDTVDPAANGNPVAPVANPLEWAVAAFARRSGAPAAAAAFQPSVCTESSTACAYILGASGVPIPSFEQAETAMKYYIQPNSPGVDFTSQIIYTPEGAYPITGIKVLPLDISVQEGLTEVQNTVFATLGVNPDIPISYFGYSQSAIIGSLLQRQLQQAVGSPVAPGQIQYVTVGQEMNPNGGWFARFPGLKFDSTGIDFYGATPANDTPETLNAYPTTNYALEYDGFADFPRYPGNALSVANAVLGIFTIHTQYLNPDYFARTYGTGLGAFDAVMGTEGPGVACNQGSSSCLALPTTTGPNGDQKYYFIKTPYLPLLQPLAQIPLIGKPLVALLQPALKVIVDLGYGDKAHGFESATQPMANVELPFGLFPQVSPIEVTEKLIAGVRQGIDDFVKSFGSAGSVQQELAAMAQSLSAPRANPFAAGDVLTGIGDLITRTASTISTALSATYATLLATADFINAAVFPLQAYNTNIVLASVKQMLAGDVAKGLINAIGLPIAADIGMLTTVGLFQLVVWIEGILAAVTGCGPAAPSYTPPSECTLLA